MMHRMTGFPIYDCSDLPGFYMAVGTSGNQFKNAPVVGMIMNALVDYVEGGNDHDKNPLKFELPNLDFTLDMAFCSRIREINRESSFSGGGIGRGGPRSRLCRLLW